MSMQHHHRLIGFAVLLGAALALALAGCGPSQDSAAQEELTTQVRRGGFTIKISEIGVLDAVQSLSISNPLRSGSSKLLRLVPEGTRVKKGDFLAEFDPTEIEEQLERQQATVDELAIRLAEAEEGLALEKIQNERDLAAARHAVLLAELELKDVLEGSGKQATIELKSNVDEAKARFERERERYKDIDDLYRQDFVSAFELSKQQIAMDEAQHDYELAQKKYDLRIQYTYPAEKARKEAGLAKAQSELGSLEKSVQRSFARERARTENARSNLSSARQKLKQAEDELKAAQVTSPGEGYVIYQKIWAGGWRKIQVGDALWRNYVFLTIPDLTAMVVNTRVREVDVHHISKGQKAGVKIDAFPELLIQGEVDAIATLAVTDRETPTPEKYFDLTVKLDQTDPRLRPGMTARVEILVGEVADALIIPVYAIFIEDGKPVCFVKTDDKPVRRQIKLGRQNADLAEVVEGLREGETILLARPPAKEKEKDKGRDKDEGKTGLPMPQGNGA